MRRKKPTAGLAFAAVAVLMLLSGCAGAGGVNLPTLPPLPTETAEPTPTPIPSPTPTPPAETVKPTLAPFPTPSPGQAQAATTSPGQTPAPTHAPEDAAEAEYQESLALPQADEAYYQTPFVTISEATLPTDMVQRNVVMLHGALSTDCGVISQVDGLIINSAGETVQQCSFYPDSAGFSLAGTVNSELHFATLTPDSYIYQLSATAVNGEVSADYVLIYHAFTVSQTAPKTGSASAAGYSARLTDDSSNAGYIWNYFIGEFNNPCAAAAILGNIDVESGCIPTRVEGDLSSDFAFSKSYTASVDDGSVNRDSFIRAKPADGYGHGYGLCQWTGDRKGALYDLASLRGASVGDLGVQCELIMLELCSNYPKLYDYLLTADSAEAAALEFCGVYEQASVWGSRAAIAQGYLDKYGV